MIASFLSGIKARVTAPVLMPTIISRGVRGIVTTDLAGGAFAVRNTNHSIILNLKQLM